MLLATLCYWESLQGVRVMLVVVILPYWRFSIHCFSTSSLSLQQTNTKFTLTVIYSFCTFSPAHDRTIYDNFILTFLGFSFQQRLLRFWAGAFTHKSFYTQKPVHTETFTHRSFTHRSFYTQELLHLLHTEASTHKSFLSGTTSSHFGYFVTQMIPGRLHLAPSSYPGHETFNFLPNFPFTTS